MTNDTSDSPGNLATRSLRNNFFNSLFNQGISSIFAGY